MHVTLAQETLWGEMVRRLGETLPESLLVPDFQGRLPLHVALTRPDAIADLVQLLLEVGPPSTRSYVLDGLLPFQFAAANSVPLDVLYFLARTLFGASRAWLARGLKSSNSDSLQVHCSGRPGIL